MKEPRKLRKTWLSHDMLVRAPQYRRRMLVTVIVNAVLGWGCLAVVTTAPYGAWWRGIFSGVLGVFIAMGCLTMFKKQHAYKMGWLDGRLALIRSGREASERGMSASEWLDAEFERDMAVLGVEPVEPQERTEDEE